MATTTSASAATKTTTSHNGDEKKIGEEKKIEEKKIENEKKTKEKKATCSSLYCVRPKDCLQRVKNDINGEEGPKARCYKRWEVFENCLSVISVSLLGASFFFSWVILQTTTFSFGQPLPMHIPGACSKL